MPRPYNWIYLGFEGRSMQVLKIILLGGAGACVADYLFCYV
jgi:hypothetical protein